MLSLLSEDELDVAGVAHVGYNSKKRCKISLGRVKMVFCYVQCGRERHRCDGDA